MASNQKSLLKLVILGDMSVGKTSLVRNYVENCFSQQSEATIGVEFFTKAVVLQNRKIKMQIWDTSGMERFKAITSSYYRGSDCCIIVFDVTNPNSFHNLDSWHKKFLVLASPDDPKTFPFVVLGNKVDLKNEVISRLEAEMWCKSKNNIPYFETSAKKGINVNLAFQTIAKNALAQASEVELYHEFPDPISLTANNNRPRNGNPDCSC